MPSARVRGQVWCEDRHQEQFARKFSFRKFGLTWRDVQVRPAPKGNGSAAQWVIENFPHATRVARTGKNQQRLGVLVIVDGDTEGVESRKRSLLQPPNDRRDDLRVAICVPSRNIETWVKYLSSPLPRPAADREDTDFKLEAGHEWDELLPLAIAQWDANSSAPGLASLKDAHDELGRLPLG
jgi:hypothetical protein